MNKVAVLLADKFDENELIYPYYRLKEEFEVDLVSAQGDKEYTSKAGVTKKSTKAAKDVNVDEYLGVVIPGGFSPDNMRLSEDMKNLVKEFDKNNKAIAAICHGPWMLASSADIKGKEVTSFQSIKDDLVNAGGNWVDKEVVVSDNIITSRTPDDLPAFMKAFIEKIK